MDDTPYGGGAGMVMKPEPWAQALESVAAAAWTGRRGRKPVLIVPSPAGEVFTQALAYELAEEEHLVFACGRYEGIDERVLEWAAEHFTVRPVSLGDYVLNGGEVAVLAMVEAIGRLLPGVVGNPESLVEESHSDGLLEYPVYTKPSSWRDRDVPEVLLSGNHGKIAKFRRDEQLRRTAERRPDLIAALDAGDLTKADRATPRRTWGTPSSTAACSAALAAAAPADPAQPRQDANSPEHRRHVAKLSLVSAGFAPATGGAQPTAGTPALPLTGRSR